MSAPPNILGPGRRRQGQGRSRYPPPPDFSVDSARPSFLGPRAGSVQYPDADLLQDSRVRHEQLTYTDMNVHSSMPGHLQFSPHQIGVSGGDYSNQAQHGQHVMHAPLMHPMHQLHQLQLHQMQHAHQMQLNQQMHYAQQMRHVQHVHPVHQAHHVQMFHQIQARAQQAVQYAPSTLSNATASTGQRQQYQPTFRTAELAPQTDPRFVQQAHPFARSRSPPGGIRARKAPSDSTDMRQGTFGTSIEQKNFGMRQARKSTVGLSGRTFVAEGLPQPSGRSPRESKSSAELAVAETELRKLGAKLPGESPEEIQKWIQARRANWPTKANIARKQAEAAARASRGEIDLVRGQPSLKQAVAEQKQAGKRRRREGKGGIVYGNKPVSETGLVQSGGLAAIAQYVNASSDDSSGEDIDETCADNVEKTESLPEKAGSTAVRVPHPQKHGNAGGGKIRKRKGKKGKKKVQGKNCAESYSTVKPTLLWKLLEPEIRREQNLLLQCFRVLVEENFFCDKKNISEVSDTSAQSS